MNTFLIVCKLNSTPSNYLALNKYLKTAPRWANLFDGAWIIQTSSSSSYIRDGVRSRVQPNDKVLVIATPADDWGSSNLSKEVTNWMKSLG